jgi:hypothetical protein
MMNFRYLAAAVTICFLGVTGCRHVEDSEIVAKFKAAGGGNPDQADVSQIGAWFSQHDQARQELNTPCSAKRKTAPADWANTDEGKICNGVAQATFFALPPPAPKDRNTF